jgi:hypothetical protein
VVPAEREDLVGRPLPGEATALALMIHHLSTFISWSVRLKWRACMYWVLSFSDDENTGRS